MIAIGLLFVRMLCDFFKPRPRLEAEILILRHQLNVLQQRTPRRRLHLRWVDPSLTLPGCFSGVFPIKRAGEASGSEQEKLQPACLFPEASGSARPPLHPLPPFRPRGP